MTAKEKADELLMKFAPELLNVLEFSNETFEINRKFALICVDEKILLIKKIIDESVNVHQSLSTEKKLCINILNPMLKELQEVKKEIEKL